MITDDSAAFSAVAFVQTQLTNEALTDHYVEQMRQARWTQQTATASEQTFVSLWRIETDDGAVWHSLLSLIPQSDPGQWTGYFTIVSDTNFAEEMSHAE